MRFNILKQHSLVYRLNAVALLHAMLCYTRVVCAQCDCDIYCVQQDYKSRTSRWHAVRVVHWTLLEG